MQPRLLSGRLASVSMLRTVLSASLCCSVCAAACDSFPGSRAEPRALVPGSRAEPRASTFAHVGEEPARVATSAELARVDASDELALGRLADRVGDAALAAHLRPDGPRYEALIAIRASEHARAPELLVPALAALACGRDPALAPEAAHALRTLTGLVRPSALAERETLRSDLQTAQAALRCSDPPRPDLATTLDRLAQTLSALD